MENLVEESGSYADEDLEALAGAGIEVESSNYEYGPGQIEINCGHADAMRTADNTVLFKSIVKQVAVAHGHRAVRRVDLPVVELQEPAAGLRRSERILGRRDVVPGVGVPERNRRVRSAGDLFVVDRDLSVVLVANIVTNRVLRAALQVGLVDVVAWA